MKLYYKFSQRVCLAFIGLWCLVGQATAQPTANLLHHYTLDNKLSNEAGSHTITGISNFTADRFNRSNYAFYVENDNNTISDAGIPNMPTGSSKRTIAFWFQNPMADRNYNLFSYGTTGQGYGTGYAIAYNSLTGVLTISNGMFNKTHNIGRSTEWRHLAVTYDESGFKNTVYINGAYVAELALNLGLTDASPVRIGEDLYGTKTSNFKIDEIFIYGTALSATEIQTIYNRKCVQDQVATPSAASICPGESIKINFDKVISVYSAQQNGTLLAINDSYTTPSLSTTTTYYIQAGAGTCTSNMAPVTVTVKAAAPKPVSTTDNLLGNVCGTGSATLTVETNASYTTKWYNSSSGGTAIATGPTFVTPVLSSDNMYYAAYEGTNICPSARSAMYVAVYPKPVVNLVASKISICPVEEVTFSGFENVAYNLKKNGSFASGGDGYDGMPYSYQDTPQQTSTYVLSVGEWIGCQSTATVTVTVKPVPEVVISASKSTICSGENVDLTASGATGYVWSTGGRTASTTQSPTVTTTYSVTGTSGATGCSKTASTTVTVKELPNVVISPASATICRGESTTLTASGATTYSWSTAATTTAITPSPTTTTTYEVTSTSNGCSKTAYATVTVKASPAVAITPAVATVCQGETTTLTASGATAYSWSTSATTATITTSPTIATYTVTGTKDGCSKTASYSIGIKALPTVTITPTAASICSGESTTLTASGTAATAYLWSTSATTDVITPSPTTTTTYTVTGTRSGCSNTASVTVTVNPLPVPVVSQIDNVLSTEAYSSYQWYENESPISNSNTQNYQISNSGSYSVYVTDAKGCAAMSAPFNTFVTSVKDGLNSVRSINVYPNPASSVLNLNSSQETQINVLNLLGESVERFTIQNGQNSVNINHLHPGLYILQTEIGEIIKFTKE